MDGLERCRGCGEPVDPDFGPCCPDPAWWAAKAGKVKAAIAKVKTLRVLAEAQRKLYGVLQRSLEDQLRRIE